MKEVLLKVRIKRGILILCALFSYLTGLYLLFRRRRKGKFLILYYHSVNPHRRHEVNVKPEVFQKQMVYLKNHFSPVTLEKGVERMRRGEGSSLPWVALTFDDGYQDNYTYAYPILRELGIPFTIFLTVGYIGGDKLLPHDQNDLPQHNYLLNWDQIREMLKGGVEFGIHGMNHRRVAGLAEEDLRTEVVRAKEVSQKAIGKIISFAYPYGGREDIDRKARDMVKKAGFRYACTAIYGVNGSSSDPLFLKRIGVEASDTMFTFASKLNGALDILTWKEGRVKGVVKLINKILKV